MSGKLTPIPLSPAAERIRNQIKEMIPETSAGDLGEQKSEKAERLETGSGGGVMYGGNLLAKRISELVNQMDGTDIGKVGGCFQRLRCLTHQKYRIGNGP